MSPGKLPATNARRTITALTRAGFRLDRVVGSHHLMIHATDPRRRVTIPVHSGRDLKPGTLRSIIRQAGLTVDEFAALL